MAQNTGFISSKDYKIEVSLNGSSWLDHSGTATKVTPSGGERASGDAYTFDGDTAAIGYGKRAPLMLNVEYLYSEGASDLFEVARAAYEARSDFYLRYAPKNGQTGEFLFTTVAGGITNFVYPPGDASSGDPVVCSFDLKVASMPKSVA